MEGGNAVKPAPLLCPGCGYDCRPDVESFRRKMASLRLGRVHLGMIQCDGCARMLDFDAGLSLDGVGPERLVAVDVAKRILDGSPTDWTRSEE